MFERSGTYFTFEIDVKSETGERNTVKALTRCMEVDGVAGVPSYYDAICKGEHEETECTPRGGFGRQKVRNPIGNQAMR